MPPEQIFLIRIPTSVSYAGWKRQCWSVFCHEISSQLKQKKLEIKKWVVIFETINCGPIYFFGNLIYWLLTGLKNQLCYIISTQQMINWSVLGGWDIFWEVPNMDGLVCKAFLHMSEIIQLFILRQSTHQTHLTRVLSCNTNSKKNY